MKYNTIQEAYKQVLIREFKDNDSMNTAIANSNNNPAPVQPQQQPTQNEENLAEWIKARLAKKLPEDSPVLKHLNAIVSELDANELSKAISQPANPV
jgi:hypothetical protein